VPIIQSAKKRARQDLKRRARNMAARTEIKTLVKKCRQAIADGELEEARRVARLAESCLAKAAKRGIIHRNTARRKAMRLHRAVSAAAAGEVAATE